MSLLSKLSDNCSSTQAEIMAITYALKEVFENSETKKLAIITDSQAAMQAIANYYPHTNKQIIKYAHQALIRLNDRYTQVIFIWVPSHIGIPGNEKVDSLAALAKNGTDAPPSPNTPAFVVDHIQEVPKSVTQIHSKIFSAVQSVYENDLQQQALVSDGLSWNLEFCKKPVKLPRDTSRRSQRYFHKIRLGYKDFIELTHKPFPPCQNCNRFYSDKHLKHFLLECESTEYLRLQLRNELQLPDMYCDLPQIMDWLGNTKLLSIVLRHLSANPPLPQLFNNRSANS
jgi:ribonuclease HI